MFNYPCDVLFGWGWWAISMSLERKGDGGLGLLYLHSLLSPATWSPGLPAPSTKYKQPDYEFPRFLDSHITRFSRFRDYEITRFRDYEITRLRVSQITRFPDSQITRFPDSQITRFPDS